MKPYTGAVTCVGIDYTHRSALHLNTVCTLRKQFMHKGTDLTISNLCCTNKVLVIMNQTLKQSHELLYSEYSALNFGRLIFRNFQLRDASKDVWQNKFHFL